MFLVWIVDYRPYYGLSSCPRVVDWSWLAGQLKGSISLIDAFVDCSVALTIIGCRKVVTWNLLIYVGVG